MFLGTGLVGGADTPAPVQLPAINFATSNTSAPVYSGVRFDSDGKIYRMDAVGNWQYSGSAWLLEGAASSYYLFRTVTSGSLTNDDGDGNVLSTDDLDYWISSSITWFARECSVEFKIADDTAGSNVLATRTYALSAYRQGTGSPP